MSQKKTWPIWSSVLDSTKTTRREPFGIRRPRRTFLVAKRTWSSLALARGVFWPVDSAPRFALLRANFAVGFGFLTVSARPQLLRRHWTTAWDPFGPSTRTDVTRTPPDASRHARPA